MSDWRYMAARGLDCVLLVVAFMVLLLSIRAVGMLELAEVRQVQLVEICRSSPYTSVSLEVRP